MKIVLFLIFLSTINSTYGQSSILESTEQSIYSKVAVLIILALISIYNYAKWLNETPKTDP